MTRVRRHGLLPGWLIRWSDRVRRRARARAWPVDRALGRDGEDVAHRYLESKGFVVVARNYQSRSGTAEVDIIAREGATLVFIEVKSRTSGDYGAPERAVSSDKRRKIVRAAADYVRRSGHDPRDIRFDIVTVVFQPEPKVEHFQRAFVPRELW